ncbi:MAG: glycosyltransferase [Bacteroidales bacterium]|nr:glycosyltransferase [Bacteroidales bacterium]
MKLVIYSIVLNHHQVFVADAFYDLLREAYVFVETTNLRDTKGATEDYSKRPYLLRAWQSKENYSKAMELAQTAECCVFSGVQALPFWKKRMKLGLLSFDMSERWLKRGIFNLFSPAILKMFFAYHLGGWRSKPLYKLCCSAFAAADQYKVGTYHDRCYKWGYFTKVEKIDVEAFLDSSTSNVTQFMWCSRYLMWKHPELPILMAHRLKQLGYRFLLDMYGSGEYEIQARLLAKELDVEDVVRFMGVKPNDELLDDMRRHGIFLFTSDRNEGWGAVANESMSNGCVLVASDGIGSVPYLINDGKTGMSFITPKQSSGFAHPDITALDSLCHKIESLLADPRKWRCIRNSAVCLMQELWNPHIAAERLLILIDSIEKGKDTPFAEGPCSKA